MIGPMAEQGTRNAAHVRPTVVLADDVPAIRALLRHTLEDSFEIVGEAADGDKAIHAAAELRPDVVLLDLNMPGRDGLEAIAGIRERAPSTLIVVLTGLEPQLVERQVLQLGASAFLEKSAPLEDVHARLRELVGLQPLAA